MSQSFHLVIKTISPMHIPDASVDTPSGQATPTTRKLYADIEGKVYQEVSMGSNGVRGRVRRVLADMISHRVAEMGMTFTPAAARGFLNSKATGIPASSDASISLINESLANPFTGLLGGGKYLLNSLLSVGEVNLITERNINNGFVPEWFGELAILDGQAITRRFTKISKDSTVDGTVFDGIASSVEDYYQHLEEWKSLIALNRSERSEAKAAQDDEALKLAREETMKELKIKIEAEIEKTLKDDVISAFEAKEKSYTDKELHSAMTKERTKRVKAALKRVEQESKKQDIQNMMEIEVIAAGVNFHCHITNKERPMSDTQIGLLLKGLVEMAKSKNFGINGSIGHGRYHISVYDEQQNAMVYLSDDTGSYAFSPEAQQFLEKAEDFLDEIDQSFVDTIEAVYA